MNKRGVCSLAARYRTERNLLYFWRQQAIRPEIFLRDKELIMTLNSKLAAALNEQIGHEFGAKLQYL
ncbi:MAG: hypothetical protein ACK2U5_20885, partial [Candidatus Promineifilaceae bacterium]